MLILRPSVAYLPEVHVDRIEFNTFHSGKHEYKQVILWEWAGWNYLNEKGVTVSRCGYRVVCWWMLREKQQPPRYNHRRRRYEMLVWREGRLSRVVASSVWVTDTKGYDPEIDDRRVWSKDRRRGFR